MTYHKSCGKLKNGKFPGRQIETFIFHSFPSQPHVSHQVDLRFTSLRTQNLSNGIPMSINDVYLVLVKSIKKFFFSVFLFTTFFMFQNITLISSKDEKGSTLHFTFYRSVSFSFPPDETVTILLKIYFLMLRIKFA